MTLEQINYFIEIVKAGSMSQAANILFVSQPHMSMIIKSLETELGYQLLHRTSKGVELTQQGAEFLYYAENIMTNIGEMKSIKRANSLKSLEFSVTTQYVSFAIIPLFDLFNFFENQNKTITIRQKSFFEVLDDVEQGRSEIGLLSISVEQNALLKALMEKKGIEFIPLGDLDMNIAIAKGHPLFDRETLSISDLIQYPLVFFDISDKEYLSALGLKQLGYDLFTKKILVQDFFYIYHLLSTTDAVSFIGVYKSININLLYKTAGLQLKFFPLDPPVSVELGFIKRTNETLTFMGQYFINTVEKLLGPIEQTAD